MKRLLLFALLISLLVIADCGGASSSLSGDKTDPGAGSDTSNVPAEVTAKRHCIFAGGLPDKACTPGAVNSAVNQGNIQSTICAKGWTASIRPAPSYTDGLKRQGIVDYGYPDRRLSSYEEDHLLPLEMGGDPRNPLNLWPEPASPKPGFHEKDLVENAGRAAICSGKIMLATAQVKSDWRAFGQELGVLK